MAFDLTKTTGGITPDSVSSVFGRTGAVAAQEGDYSISQLSDVTTSTPSAGQVLKWDGVEWVNGDPVSVSAGVGVALYFDDTLSGVDSYETIDFFPDDLPEVDEMVTVSNGSPAFIHGYATPNALGRTLIDSGVWDFSIYAYATPSAGTSILTFDVYKRASGGTETLLFSVATDDIDFASVGLMNAHTVQPSFVIDATDRLIIKVTASTTHGGNVDVHFVHSGTEHYSFIKTPLITLHNDLAGLQGGSGDEMYHLSLAEKVVVQNTSGTNTGDQTDATLPFSDITTNNATTLKHGFLPKLSGVAGQFLNGEGNYATPVGVVNSYFSQSFTNQTSVTVTHNFGAEPGVQTYDANGKEFIPYDVVQLTPNSFRVDFSPASSGTIKAQLGAPQAQNVVIVNSNYTVLVTDYFVIANAFGITITLPTAVGNTGRVYQIINATDGNIIVDANGSETIFGELTQPIAGKSTISVVSDGTNWQIY